LSEKASKIIEKCKNEKVVAKNANGV